MNKRHLGLDRHTPPYMYSTLQLKGHGDGMYEQVLVYLETEKGLMETGNGGW